MLPSGTQPSWSLKYATSMSSAPPTTRTGTTWSRSLPIHCARSVTHTCSASGVTCRSICNGSWHRSFSVRGAPLLSRGFLNSCMAAGLLSCQWKPAVIVAIVGIPRINGVSKSANTTNFIGIRTTVQQPSSRSKSLVVSVCGFSTPCGATVQSSSNTAVPSARLTCPVAMRADPPFVIGCTYDLHPGPYIRAIMGPLTTLKSDPESQSSASHHTGLPSPPAERTCPAV